jgi:glutamine synthetase
VARRQWRVTWRRVRLRESGLPNAPLGSSYGMPKDMPEASEELVALPAGTRFVDVFVADVNGLTRGKRVPAGAWPGVLRGGVGFSRGALVLDARGVLQGPLGIGTADGDPDGIATPLIEHLAPVPWSTHGVAQCLMRMRGQGGEPLWFDPREILRATVARCHADGLFPVVACELEFTLVGGDAAGRPAPFPAARGGVGRPDGGHLCVQQVEDYGAFLHVLHDALCRQGIAAETIVSEYGRGQFEVNVSHSADPLRAADQAVLLRRAVVGVAASQGLRASFMAKPFQDRAGNGLHIHLSLADENGRNRFAQDGGEADLRAAIAGMQRLHGESLALFAPSFSAFRRYRAGSFVSMVSSWGENSRSVAFRIPTGNRAARRVEHRVAGADASPHLAMTAILAAAHYGVTNQLTPDAADGSSSDALPGDILAALARLETGTLLAGYLPADFPRLFAALKRAEFADLFAQVQSVEHDFYL